MSIGTLIYQVLVVLIPISVTAAIVLFARSSKKKREQLNRIEAKLDKVTDTTPKTR